jgi:addiction module RelB/DinJ family antitoxin
MDEDLKKQFDMICKELGMNTSTAIIFAREVVSQRRIPFEITASHKDITKEDAVQAFMALRNSAKENGLQDMSLDDINAEINAVRNDDSE